MVKRQSAVGYSIIHYYKKLKLIHKNSNSETKKLNGDYCTNQVGECDSSKGLSCLGENETMICS